MQCHVIVGQSRDRVFFLVLRFVGQHPFSARLTSRHGLRRLTGVALAAWTREGPGSNSRLPLKDPAFYSMVPGMCLGYSFGGVLPSRGLCDYFAFTDTAAYALGR